tara:strand:- start:261 stop:416 length:156 start_codon:yes stop_codon:yes gene_type:complete
MNMEQQTYLPCADCREPEFAEDLHADEHGVGRCLFCELERMMAENTTGASE